MRMLVVMSVLLAACGGSTVAVTDTDNVAGVQQASVTDPVTRVVAKSITGPIDVNVGDVGIVTLEKVGVDEEALDYSVEAGVLQIWTLCGNGAIGCGAGMIVHVPAEVDVDLETTSGALTTQAGFGGALTVRSEAGSVETVERAGGAPTEVVTDAGDVRLHDKGVPTRIDVQTGSGDITVTVPAGTYAFDAQTNADFQVDQANLEIGDGPPVVLVSVSGDIRIFGALTAE